MGNRRYIPYGRQSISDEDIAAVVAALRSDWLTQGPAIAAFEDGVRDRVGARYGVAVSNGTAALHLACLGLGLGIGKRLWTSANTFVASSNCALYCGASVDFVDIDARTLNISIAALEEKLGQAQRRGTLPDVVAPVHFGGLPCDLDDIATLATRYGFAVLEDAAHAIGAEYHGERIGACRRSVMGVFSFHPVKVMTTAEGGMIMTNNAELAEKLRLLRTHGITRDPTRLSPSETGDWFYEQVELGYNYRLTDLQASLGSSQLRRLDQFLERRRQLVARYDELLVDLPVQTQLRAADRRSANHLYPVRLDPRRFRRKDVFQRLRAAGIGVNVHYIPVHTQPCYRKLGFRVGDFPQAEAYYAGALSLPLHQELTEEEQDYVVAQLKDALVKSAVGG